VNKEEYSIMFSLEKEYWWYRGLRDLVENFTKKMALARNEVQIFDAGCGTGGTLQMLAKYGHPQGIDYSQDAVAFCNKNSLQDVRRQDLNDWQPSGNTYDIVVSLDVLCHSAILDPEGIFRKFALALKPGGMCIVNLPAFPLLFRNHDRAVHTQRRFRLQEVERLFKNAGLTVTTASYRLPHIFILLLIKKTMEKFSASSHSQSDLKSMPPLLNAFLYFLNRLENRIICAGFRLPLGSSVFVIGRKE
jgi:2-polyprenyl-3-methyl-5-hydroxy-6-metoxy-1,4-benzoquinol methylase